MHIPNKPEAWRVNSRTPVNILTVCLQKETVKGIKAFRGRRTPVEQSGMFQE